MASSRLILMSVRPAPLQSSESASAEPYEPRLPADLYAVGSTATAASQKQLLSLLARLPSHIVVATIPPFFVTRRISSRLGRIRDEVQPSNAMQRSNEPSG